MADNQPKKSGGSKGRRGKSMGGKQQADARRAARRAAREAVLALLFETEFHAEDTPEAVLLRAADARGLASVDAVASGDTETAPAPRDEAYIRATFLGIMENLSILDALIGRHAKGWSTGRLSRVSRAVLRLGVYELAFDEKIPAPIAINEAVELSKKFDDPKARAFINGVLNAVKNELAENGGRIPPAIVIAALQNEAAKTEAARENTPTPDGLSLPLDSAPTDGEPMAAPDEAGTDEAAADGQPATDMPEAETEDALDASEEPDGDA